MLARTLVPVFFFSKIRCPVNRLRQSFNLFENVVVCDQYGKGSDGLCRDQQVHFRHHNSLRFEARFRLGINSSFLTIPRKDLNVRKQLFNGSARERGNACFAI